MSGVVVAIGYLLLIPSALGVLLSTISFITATAHGDTSTTASIVSSVFIAFGVASFIGGLFGWLLVMKKEVLQCDHCGATIAAS
jgi:hypothetical protein